MNLPNADRAVIDRRKLAEYVLSSAHPVGRHKAAVFMAALGFGQADADALAGLIAEAARTGEASPGPADEFGQRYAVDFVAVTTTGRATIRSAWLVRVGEDFPRLTTCYILPRTSE